MLMGHCRIGTPDTRTDLGGQLGVDKTANIVLAENVFRRRHGVQGPTPINSGPTAESPLTLERANSKVAPGKTPR